MYELKKKYSLVPKKDQNVLKLTTKIKKINKKIKKSLACKQYTVYKHST